jgi:hypothetical protein
MEIRGTLTPRRWRRSEGVRCLCPLARLNSGTPEQKFRRLRTSPVRNQPEYSAAPSAAIDRSCIFLFDRRRNMAQVYFHCSNPQEVLIDRCGAAIGDIAEAREHAALVVRSLIMAPGPEDWRGWLLHVSDDLGEEIFTVPFASLLGKPH